MIVVSGSTVPSFRSGAVSPNVSVTGDVGKRMAEEEEEERMRLTNELQEIERERLVDTRVMY